MADPEIFPPKGYYRIDEAFSYWLKTCFGHTELTAAERDASREEFIEWLECHSLVVSIYSADGAAHEVPAAAWDRKWFPDMLVLYRAIPFTAGSPFERYAGAILIVPRPAIERWAESRLRDELLFSLSHGKIKLQAAQDIAATAGIGDLESNPDSNTYNPMEQTYWSVPMAIAWIATKEAETVRKYWDTYRERLSHFHPLTLQVPVGETNTGWLLQNAKLASVPMMLSRGMKGEKDQCFTALESGKIIATGISEEDLKRCPIPKHEWQDLRSYKYGEREVFRTGQGAKGYTDVTLERDAVMALWPASFAPANEATLSAESEKPPIQKSQKEPLLGHDMMVDWAKEHMILNKHRRTTRKEEMDLIAEAFPGFRIPGKGKYDEARRASADELQMSYWYARGPKVGVPAVKKSVTANLPEIVRGKYAQQIRDNIRISKDLKP